MSRFRKVDAATWGDARFVGLSQDAKFLWLYLLTGPHVTSLPGLFLLSKVSLAEALGWSSRKLDAAVSQITRTVDGHPFPMAKVDWKSRVVWLPNAAKHNRPTNRPSVVGWEGHWKSIPECPLKEEATEHLRPFLAAWGAEYLSAFEEFAPSKGPRSTPSDRASDSTSNGRSDHRSNQPSNPPSNHTRARVPAPAPAPAPALPAGGSTSQVGSPTSRTAAEPIVVFSSASGVEAVEVFVDAVSEALGRRISVPNEPAPRKDLASAINTHLRGDGTVRGALVALRQAAEDWVDEYREKAHLTAGWQPRKFMHWLNEREPMTELEPPPRAPAPETLPVDRGPLPTEEQKLENRRRFAQLASDGFGGKLL